MNTSDEKTCDQLVRELIPSRIDDLMPREYAKLRDKIALAVLLQSISVPGIVPQTKDRWAADAYDFADAMLAARRA